MTFGDTVYKYSASLCHRAPLRSTWTRKRRGMYGAYKALAALLLNNKSAALETCRFPLYFIRAHATPADSFLTHIIK